MIGSAPSRCGGTRTVESGNQKVVEGLFSSATNANIYRTRFWKLFRLESKGREEAIALKVLNRQTKEDKIVGHEVRFVIVKPVGIFEVSTFGFDSQGEKSPCSDLNAFNT